MNRDRFLIPSKASAESAGAVSRFISFLRRHRLPGMFDLASPPDADSLFVTLEVEKRACIDGGNNLPFCSEEVISGAQRDIVDCHRKLQDRARGKVEKLATKLLIEARRIDRSEVADYLRDMPSKCQNKIDRVRAEFDSKLKLLHAQEVYKQQCLDHNDEQSQEDDSGGPATKAFFFVIMLAVASLVSLALGSDILWRGDVGSLLNAEAAIAVAIIAVALPFLIAVVVSKPVSAKLNRKRPAFRLAMLLTTALLGLVAFSCAHLIILSADVPVASAADISAVLNAMTTEPGAFSGDVNALKGFGVVMVTGFLGFVLGNLSINTDSENDDVRAAYLNAREGREKLTRQLHKQVNGIVDAAEKDVDSSTKRLQKRFKKLSRLVEQARDTQARYDDYLAGLEESCNLLLERYRQANAAVRNTAIPPSFSERICFRLEGASRKSFFKDGIERHRQADIEMKDFPETIAKVRRDLWNLNRDTIQSLGAVEAHEETDESYAYT
jgi:hypothetical protein